MLQSSRSLQGMSGPPSPVVAEANLTFRLHPDELSIREDLCIFWLAPMTDNNPEGPRDIPVASCE